MERNVFLNNLGNDLIVQRLTGASVMHYSHIHPQYEIYFCPENIRQYSIINGIEYNYQFPCVIISKPYSIHSMSCMETQDASFERYVIYFSLNEKNEMGKKQLSTSISDEKMGLLFELTEQQAIHLRDILNLFDTQSEEYPFSENEGALVISLFINRLFSFCAPNKITQIGNSEFYIQDVLRYIAENFANNITIFDVAKHFAVSRSKLERDFRKATYRTPHDFIDMCRINQAKILLASKEGYSISEVSSRCGFSSETYFFPFFQKHVGVSPAEYRKNAIKNKQIFKSKPKVIIKQIN